MRSVKKVADRLKECSDESRRVFLDLGYAILDAETKEEVESLFKVLCGEGGLEEVVEFLPNGARVQNYIRQHNPDHWSKCRKWSEWWRRPRHLSKPTYTSNTPLCYCYPKLVHRYVVFRIL